MRGFFDRVRGVIVLSQKVGAAQGAYITAIHEFTHHMESDPNYGKYAESVLKAAYGENHKDSDARLADEAAIRDEYAQRGQELTDDLLKKELVAAATEKILLSDEAFMRTLFEDGNGSVAVRLLGSIDDFLRKDKARKEGKEALGRYDLLKAARSEMKNAIRNAGKWKAGQTGEVQASISATDPGHYDYSKPFAEQVQDWFNGTIPAKDTLLLGKTPDVLRGIGLSNLPLAIDQGHMRKMFGDPKKGKKPKNDDHNLDRRIIEDLPRLIENPIAIIENRRYLKSGTLDTRRLETGLIIIVEGMDSDGKQYTIAVNLENQGAFNMVSVDATRMKTAISRGDLEARIEQAVNRERNGEVGVYYVNKKAIPNEPSQLHELSALEQNGFIHSILDKDSPVKYTPIEQMKTHQFAHWFKDSVVRHEDGTPKIMYRGDATEINIFDRKMAKYSGLYGRGFYFTDSKGHANTYGTARPFYLNVEHPLSATSGSKLITESQLRAFLEAVAEDEDYGIENYGYGKTVDSIVDDLKGKPDFDVLQNINATCIGDFVAAVELFNKVNGTHYDGIITPTETVVFDSAQIKSADRNIGLFDPKNRDVRYSLQATERRQDMAGNRQMGYADHEADEQGYLPLPDGGVTMQEQPDTEQMRIEEKAQIGETTRKVLANIDALNAQEEVSYDNPWKVGINPFQREQIAKYGLENVKLPGLNYSRATLEQRMLCAILSTPQDNRGKGVMTLSEQLAELDKMRKNPFASALAVVTNADYAYILAQAAIVEASEVDESGIPVTEEGKQAYARMLDAQANIQPVSVSEKANAWRFISMLSSPVTTVKNVAGNQIAQEADRVSKAGIVWLDKMIAKKTGTRMLDNATRAERKEGSQAAVQRGRNAFDDYFVVKANTSRSFE